MSTPMIAANCKGVDVPDSPFLNETRIERINAARYERQEIAGALKTVKSTDRVLEMGAGLGIVGGVVAKNAKPEKVVSYEANPEMIPHAEKLYEINDIDSVIEVRNQVLLCGEDRPDEITFYQQNSFLGSSLIPKAGRKLREVQVPTADFNEAIREMKATVLVIDIEGGELELLENSDLEGIRAVVIEFHPGAYGKEGMQACKGKLRSLGFKKDEEVSDRLVWTCTREI